MPICYSLTFRCAWLLVLSASVDYEVSYIAIMFVNLFELLIVLFMQFDFSFVFWNFFSVLFFVNVDCMFCYMIFFVVWYQWWIWWRIYVSITKCWNGTTKFTSNVTTNTKSKSKQKKQEETVQKTKQATQLFSVSHLFMLL